MEGGGGGLQLALQMAIYHQQKQAPMSCIILMGPKDAILQALIIMRQSCHQYILQTMFYSHKAET